ncbi:MAG: chromosome partitioning protein ParB [Betaproteobacteria bacterium]|jgi:hypothetical protein|nr:chromosome partitioning protein ParB [Betaproteobacteria bacterium]MEA3157057.1 hypothetical protein [Betaproteobacteria bacterium]
MKIKSSQPILCLRPTQFSVGVLEVEHKVVEAQRLSRKKLAKLVRNTPVPIVVAPWGDLFVLDRHHFIFMCWHLKVRKLRVEIVKDYSQSKLSYREFWRRMVEDHCAHLYDQFGDGPREALYLPHDIRGLADDPYRSLAWMARKEGAYENSDEKFAEFKWADFFRNERLLAKHGRAGFVPAVKQAWTLARSRAAMKLPGYIAPHLAKTDAPRSGRGKSAFIPEPQSTGDLASIPTTK